MSSSLNRDMAAPVHSWREEAAERGISEIKLEELLEAWFLEHFEPPTSFGELIHGVFC